MGQCWETKTQMVRPRPGKAGVRNLRAQMPAFALSKGFSSAPFSPVLELSVQFVTSRPYLPAPGPFVCLQTGLTKSVCLEFGVEGLKGLALEDENFKGLVH
jgi:hypothetical protein